MDPFSSAIEEGIAAEDFSAWDIPTAVPTDAQGKELIPELVGRMPTHNESVLLAGIPVSMASTNVREIWYHWQSMKLFVRFLNDGLYTYNGASLSIAVGMIETMSPGRYVWNVLRVEFPDEGTVGGTYTRLIRGTWKGSRPKAQVVRIVKRKGKRVGE